MSFEDHARRLARLEGRMQRIETMMQAVLIRLGINPAEMEPHLPPLSRAIQEALLAGDKLKAIKLYREMYGVGLKEAQDAIEGGQAGPRK